MQKLSPARAQEMARSLMQGQTSEQVQKVARELIDWSNKNRQRLSEAVDRLRRQARYRERLALLSAEVTRMDAPIATGGPMEADDRLRLLFTCCHPALSREAQVALTLRTVGGLDTRSVARAFLVPEATIAQRIVRAKRKIRDAAIP